MRLPARSVRKDPWYAAGLTFECQGCGACCAGPGEGYVWVTPEEIGAIVEHLGISRQEVHSKYARKVGRRFSLRELPVSKDCVFLEANCQDRRHCGIYPVRPNQCRTWPFWKSNLRSPKAWASAQARCVGINRGRTHSLQEIQALCSATRE